MAAPANQRKKKLNKIEIEKRLDDDIRKRYTHIIPRANAIEFLLPETGGINNMLFHSMPLVNVDQQGKLSSAGELGQLKYYYIPQNNFNNVTNLFTKYSIPEAMYQDLIGTYLSMFFAHCSAFHSTNFNEEYERNQKELFAALDFLESSFDEKILIRGISFEFQDRFEGRDSRGHLNLGKMKSKKFKGYVAVQFIERVLQNYKAAKSYDTMQSMYGHRKKYGKPDMFFGHKNAEKHSQSYFSFVIFKYLKTTLFNSAFDLLYKPEEYKVEIKRLRKLYSRRKMFSFIGELMIESQLLEMKENYLEDDIIENIEKKLTPHLRATKKKIEDIKERNEKSTDGSYEVTMFGDFF